MNRFAMLLLVLSVLFSTMRGVLSKKLGVCGKNGYGFALIQTYLFAIAALTAFLLNIKSVIAPSLSVVILALVYGIFTVLSQWMYTKALAKANISICSMIYSFGFIIPTVFGTVVWHEKIGIFKIASIAFCIVTVILVSVGKEHESRKSKKLPWELFAAMVASGGLGVVQKLQQKSNAGGETGTFLLISFLLASMISLVVSLFCHKNSEPIRTDRSLIGCLLVVGVSMAVANTANTLLAGELPSAVAFPITNVGVILASTLVSVRLMKEKLLKNQIVAFFMGIVAIVLLNL